MPSLLFYYEVHVERIPIAYIWRLVLMEYENTMREVVEHPCVIQ